MEAEDKVVSEVHHFSREIPCYEDDTSGGKEISQIANALTETKIGEGSGSLKHQSTLDEKEESMFTCLLGSNGQVVLWNPDLETVLSRFEFSYPFSMIKDLPRKSLDISVDKDGDYDVLRKRDLNKKDGIILIEQRFSPQEHQSATTLDLVGEQVWRGAFFLADYIFHNALNFKDANILEIASGVGLTSVVASMLANKVIVTDMDKGDILDLITRNLERNKELSFAETHVKEVDFYDLRTITDLGHLKEDVSVILAADVIYHNQLTDAFLNAVLFLMKEKPNKVLYVALEKRYVFTIEDMDTVAPCYEYFVSGLEWLKTQETSTVSWRIEELPTENLPQYFTYERTRHLVLWKVEAFVKTP